MAVVRFKAKIHGRVQGVGYRYFARSEAQELGLVGCARNLYTGEVEVIAEGEQGLLYKYLRRLREGPLSSDVTDIDLSWETPTGSFDRFYVKH